MYPTSNLWKNLVSEERHTFETKVVINDVTYGQNQIFSMSADLRMFSEQQPSVGGCLAGELTLRMLAPSEAIPRMAKIEPYVRVTDGAQYSEWIPHGKYYIDTREITKNDDDLQILTIHAYDAMLKTEADYPNTTHSWPQTDIQTVREIASTIGVGVDSRTVATMTHAYPISLPASYSMREVLGRIAAMYAGNWYMSYAGDLLLATINGIPPDTNYLIDNIGNTITFGGDRILV